MAVNKKPVLNRNETGKFVPGTSGNPNGRPKGIADKRLQLNQLLESRADELVGKAIELALEGDGNALRLCIERLIPKAKDEALSIILPSVEMIERSAQSDMGKEILRMLAGQVITIDEAKNLFSVLKNCAQNNETSINGAEFEELENLMQQYTREY